MLYLSRNCLSLGCGAEAKKGRMTQWLQSFLFLIMKGFKLIIMMATQLRKLKTNGLYYLSRHYE